MKDGCSFHWQEELRDPAVEGAGIVTTGQWSNRPVAVGVRANGSSSKYSRSPVLNGHQDFTESGKLENYELGDSNAKIRISVP